MATQVVPLVAGSLALVSCWLVFSRARERRLRREARLAEEKAESERQDKFDQEYRRSKRRQESAHRERFYAAYDLAEAIRKMPELKWQTRRWLALQAAKDVKGVTPEILIFYSLVALTRLLVLEADMFTGRDIELLKVFAKAAFRDDHLHRSLRKNPRQTLCGYDFGAEVLVLPLTWLHQAGSAQTSVLLEKMVNYADKLASNTTNGIGMRDVGRANVVRLLNEVTKASTSESPSGKATGPTELNYALLGVESAIGNDDLQMAYRRQVKDWHPDRMQTLPVELQDVASRRMQCINDAYQEIMQARQDINLKADPVE